MTLSHIIAVASGGAVGSAARYCLMQMPLVTLHKPVATLAINLLGSLLMGALMPLCRYLGLSGALTLLLTTGLLGGFTTFSTFSLDITTLLSEGNPLKALAIAVCSVAGGVLLCMGAYVAVSKILPSMQ